jgi:hypothetical protein
LTLIRGAEDRTNTKNMCVRTVEFVTNERKRVQSGFKTVEGATKAIRETTTTPSQESIIGIRNRIKEMAEVTASPGASLGGFFKAARRA